jgi:two-component system response regulator AtoC
MTSPHILVMSENPENASALCGLLTGRPCYPEIANSEADALLRVRRNPPPDLVLLELNGGRYSLRTLESLRTLCPEIKVVVVSAPHDTRKIVEAIRLGARDYLTIPVGDAELEQVIRRHAYDLSSLPQAVAEEPVEDLGDGKFLVAASAAMRKIRAQAELLASVDVPVLVLGESGTGKELVSRLIHKFSSRAAERFQKVNCAASSGEFLESELFGYEQGAFPGAVRTKAGKLEICDRGTIQLDEVSEIPAGLQVKLLHLLQDRQFFRLGGEHPIDADVRILAATNVDIDEALADGKLHEDLYYRLSAFVIQLPPLRERREDIPVLLRHLMARMAAQYSRPPVAFSRAAMDACLHYSWPGNLKELENFVKRYLVMGEEAIPRGDFRNEHRRLASASGAVFHEKLTIPRHEKPAHEEAPTVNLKSMVRDLKDEAEIKAITQALQETHWNRKRAARLLDISYRGLLYKIRQHSLTQEPETAPSSSSRDGRNGLNGHGENHTGNLETTSMYRRNNEKN